MVSNAGREASGPPPSAFTEESGDTLPSAFVVVPPSVSLVLAMAPLLPTATAAVPSKVAKRV